MILRVPDQNGVSRLCNMLEVYRSGLCNMLEVYRSGLCNMLEVYHSGLCNMFEILVRSPRFANEPVSVAWKERAEYLTIL